MLRGEPLRCEGGETLYLSTQAMFMHTTKCGCEVLDGWVITLHACRVERRLNAGVQCEM